MLCGCEEASDQLKLLTLLVDLQEYKHILPPLAPLCTSQLITKRKASLIETPSLSSRMTLFCPSSLFFPVLLSLSSLQPWDLRRPSEMLKPHLIAGTRVCSSWMNWGLIKTSWSLQWSPSLGRPGPGHRLPTFVTSHFSCINLSGKFRPSFLSEQTPERWTSGCCQWGTRVETLPLSPAQISHARLSENGAKKSFCLRVKGNSLRNDRWCFSFMLGRSTHFWSR